MRKSTIYLITSGVLALMLAFCIGVHPLLSRQVFEQTIQNQQQLVHDLQLTDLCLFTEARYTRHPSQADLHAAFQEHPLSCEHFPSGSLIRPPVALIGKQNHAMD